MMPGLMSDTFLVMRVFLMIVGDFNLLGVGAVPDKTYAPLIVNPNALLYAAVAAQRFKTVSGREPEKRKLHCRINQL